MNTHADKTQKSKKQLAAATIVQKRENLPSFQLKDNRPEATVQRKIQKLATDKNRDAIQLQKKHTNGCSCASCTSQLVQKKSAETIQEKSKDPIQLVKCKHGNQKHKCKSCQQSVDARNVNKVRTYQTPTKNKAEQKRREDAVKGKKGAIAHGSKDKSAKQSGKMSGILKGVNKKK
jgi:hypothetical protein